MSIRELLKNKKIKILASVFVILCFANGVISFGRHFNAIPMLTADLADSTIVINKLIYKVDNNEDTPISTKYEVPDNAKLIKGRLKVYKDYFTISITKQYKYLVEEYFYSNGGHETSYKYKYIHYKHIYPMNGNSYAIYK